MPSSLKTDRLVSIAVPVPGLGVLTYAVPEAWPMPQKGARARVPLGARTVMGCVVGVPSEDAPRPAVVKPVAEVLDPTPFLPPVVVDLALWVGDYYASGPGDPLSNAMPPAARRGDATPFRTVTRVRLETHEEGEAPSPPRGAKQRQALELLRQHPDGMTLAELAEGGVSAASARSLAGLRLVTIEDEVVLRDPFDDGDSADGGRWSLKTADAAGRQLTAEQAAVVSRLEAAVAAGGFRPTLLHGVTGSGKTEVYLQLAARVAASGRKVLVLVPEIGLTPAAAGIFRSRFGDRVAIQHSALSAGERHDQWHRIRRGDVDVVVGTRSAVFAPLESIGLIIVDEEHDGSYKQDEAPRYNGRDVAVMRGRMEGALVLLGSATPSLESFSNASAGRYALETLTRRVADRPMADVRIVDMREEFAARGPDVTLSEALIRAIEQRLDEKQQSLVLLNRRGFATVIFCRQCGASMECPHCSIALTFHRSRRRLRCHYCNYSTPVPRTCGECGGEFLEQSGFGTERLEADLRSRFPGARIARVDRDTIRRRGAIGGILRDVARGAIDILVGTQMIAKGHDFPAVTLVGVVSADVGLGLADFRASERTFQLLTQVVGRAGRGDVRGEAIIQTLYPGHYSVEAGAAQDYAAFYAREIDFRTSMQYPPAMALINVLVRGKSLEVALNDALDLATKVRSHRGAGRVIGPAPAALQKLKDEYRAQFFVKGRNRRAMREAVQAALAARSDLRRRVVVDVDPMTVL